MHLLNYTGKNRALMTNLKCTAFLLLLSCCCFSTLRLEAQAGSGILALHFKNEANGKAVSLGDTIYKNAFGEQYQITKLKYYISNIGFSSTGHGTQNIFLADAGLADSIKLVVPTGSYQKIFFTIGVDSALNNSGAQDGVLDPLRGMFWTWNSGYVYFKLEGFSAASGADLQRIEHHIGGYAGANNASRQIELALPETLYVREGDQRSICIRLNLDAYWKGKNEIKIASNALIMAPGALAIKSAENFPGLFSVIEIK